MVDIQEHATALARAAEVALPSWVLRCVESRVASVEGGPPSEAVRAEAEEEGRRAAAAVGRQLRSLLGADIDDQATTPLSLLRGAVRYPTGVLRRAGVPPRPRDETQAQLLPDDPYDLAPAAFADIDPALADAGIAWGAAKAYEHIRRHGGGREIPQAPPQPERPPAP